MSSQSTTVKPRQGIGRVSIVLYAALVAVLVDQATKYAAVVGLRTHPQGVSFGVLHLGLVFNPGNAATQAFQPVPTMLLQHAAVVVTFIFFAFVVKNVVARFGIGLILGGIIGNTISLLTGNHQVPDFIRLGAVWTCNVADIYIATGGLLLVAGAGATVTAALNRSLTKTPSTLETVALDT